jgi:dienelactone hydrolase
MNIRLLDYKADDVACQGYLVEPEGGGRRPGVLVAHEAPGIGESTQRRARMLAELGFVALIADVYGARGKIEQGPSFPQMESLLADRFLLRRRAQAALKALAALPNVDADRLVAVGYCFGGATVLELARSGTSLRGVVSFHGALHTPTPAQQGVVRTPILICTGAEDPLVPPEHRRAAEEEFTAAGADWQMVVYSGAKHSFTNPLMPQLEGFGYQEAADRRSWQAMQDFFAEVLA